MIEGPKILMPSYEEFCHTAKPYMRGIFKVNIIGKCHECEGNTKSCNGALCAECGDYGKTRHSVDIPWSTIKKIYRYAVCFYT